MLFFTAASRFIKDIQKSKILKNPRQSKNSIFVFDDYLKLFNLTYISAKAYPS